MTNTTTTTRRVWESHARTLASAVSYPDSDWYRPLTRVPRHRLVPNWFTAGPEGWTVVEGQADEHAWMSAAYSDTTLVTRVGELHADEAPLGVPVIGRPTSSSTHPGLVLTMLDLARIREGSRVLDVATGSGYSAALASYRAGGFAVTSIDVDPYLTAAAAERLSALGLATNVVTCDATGPLPDEKGYDAIVSMVAMPTIPASWVAALRPGGRMVTTIADTGLIITATKQPDGSARGRVEWDRASFMRTRDGADYPAGLDRLFADVREHDGDEVSTSPYPVINVMAAWDIWSLLTLTVPGIEHRMQMHDEGGLTAWMLHSDGSWARATTAAGQSTATVHQGGPRRLWDALDSIRRRWLHEGTLPVHGAAVRITEDGTTTLTRGQWTTTL